MKIFVMTDLEGVAGVSSFDEHTYPGCRHYTEAMKLLTAEVNAAVAGMLAAGVDEIIVLDGHGCGGLWIPDLRAEPLVIHGRPLSGAWRDEVAGCGAAVFIGQHAMAGTRTGNLNHTMDSNSVDYYRINDQPVGEIALFALHCGSHDVPVIYLSGDEAACAEITELIPGVCTTAVKRGLGRNSVVARTPERARQMITSDIQRAITAHQETPLLPLKWESPFVFEKRFFQSDAADAAADAPGVERVDDQTVRKTSDHIEDIVYW